MTDAIKALRDYLSKSPSVVYPQDVLEYLPAIEAENAKLRELVKRYHRLVTGTDELWSWQSVYAELQELGIEVGE